MNTLNQRLLRSMLVCCRRIRDHHYSYIEAAVDPRQTIKYWWTWCQPQQWNATMVGPTLEDSFTRPSSMRYVGLRRPVSVFNSLFTFTYPDNTDEDQRHLFVHVRLACSLAGHMLTFALLMQSPPWVFALLLIPNNPLVVQQTVARMKMIWEIVLVLEASTDPDMRDLLDELTFVKWAVPSRNLVTMNEVSIIVPGRVHNPGC